MKRNLLWIILFAAMLVVSVAAAGYLSVSNSSGTVVNIHMNSSIVYCLDLSEETSQREIILENAPCHNIIQVEHGRIRVVSATCPDQVCVRQGWIDSAAEPIICLPGKLMIIIETPAGETTQIDGVSK